MSDTWYEVETQSSAGFWGSVSRFQEEEMASIEASREVEVTSAVAARVIRVEREVVDVIERRPTTKGEDDA